MLSTVQLPRHVTCVESSTSISVAAFEARPVRMSVLDHTLPSKSSSTTAAAVNAGVASHCHLSDLAKLPKPSVAAIAASVVTEKCLPALVMLELRDNLLDWVILGSENNSPDNDGLFVFPTRFADCLVRIGISSLACARRAFVASV